MAEIQLTQGKVAIVDDCDFARISQYNWCANFLKQTGKYAARRWVKGGTNRYLHHEVLNVLPGTIVDHKDLNPLNCKRDNLRIATRSDNGMNREAPKNNTSGVKGVWRYKNKWKAVLRKNGVRYHLGYYYDIEDAAKAYAEAAERIAGEFARSSKV